MKKYHWLIAAVVLTSTSIVHANDADQEKLKKVLSCQDWMDLKSGEKLIKAIGGKRISSNSPIFDKNQNNYFSNRYQLPKSFTLYGMPVAFVDVTHDIASSDSYSVFFKGNVIKSLEKQTKVKTNDYKEINLKKLTVYQTMYYDKFSILNCQDSI